MAGSIIGWVLLGLVAGVTAKHPGQEDIGWVTAILLGVVGAIVGGGLAYLVGLGSTPDQAGGWILALAGSIALLNIGQKTIRREVSL
jgi:uncharacterized membrane protein YeaQ/YmgE (transglycosylase-associated protein family)